MKCWSRRHTSDADDAVVQHPYGVDGDHRGCRTFSTKALLAASRLSSPSSSAAASRIRLETMRTRGTPGCRRFRNLPLYVCCVPVEASLLRCVEMSAF